MRGVLVVGDVLHGSVKGCLRYRLVVEMLHGLEAYCITLVCHCLYGDMARLNIEEKG